MFQNITRGKSSRQTRLAHHKDITKTLFKKGVSNFYCYVIYKSHVTAATEYLLLTAVECAVNWVSTSLRDDGEYIYIKQHIFLHKHST